MIKSLLFVTLVFILMSCGSGKKVDKEILDEVNKSMEIKRVNEVDIINKAMEWGDEISLKAQQELMSKLQQAIEEKGVPGAVEFCNVEALPSLQKVSEAFGVNVRRVSHDFRNPSDQPTADEEQLLLAYEYNEEHDIKSKANVQEVQNGEQLLYTKAIKIPGALCLQCHGEPKADISEETLQAINSLYPEDRAKGHKIGDLRGMWSISIPKKEVVKKL
ncbi:DUF3365 domain-containing protein [Echinicola sp. CAU 1574]|uniref:DUF3365 domain-containing protein n=1 Tax=Echinicola arenosa TaxID=2774144 RepID=A0ABR9AIS4_9BACT|nr:DUF3365 domain-containing protein [Echinicola arenosa]MBD8488620.1 DUF3365 domain-containing protein [Echinicola arenosa]